MCRNVPSVLAALASATAGARTDQPLTLAPDRIVDRHADRGRAGRARR
jgi:hypothetical protein